MTIEFENAAAGHHANELIEEDKKDAAYYRPSEGVYVGADGMEPREEETHRALKPRQISMIAIGGAIGGCSDLSCETRPDTQVPVSSSVQVPLWRDPDREPSSSLMPSWESCKSPYRL